MRFYFPLIQLIIFCVSASTFVVKRQSGLDSSDSDDVKIRAKRLYYVPYGTTYGNTYGNTYGTNYYGSGYNYPTYSGYGGYGGYYPTMSNGIFPLPGGYYPGSIVGAGSMWAAHGGLVGNILGFLIG
ncbi:unnamed protein product [Caenorhabditis bovis]|uniref:Uncharacterized protein n=1 Tax=Caenorhabditis bovis TaxID=2654633 RepID=A0A8S1E2T5_9PELO|nr:unnamed protein product [Caenorhabditis bovis]